MHKAKVSSTLPGTNQLPTKPIPEDLKARAVNLSDNARVVLQKRYLRRGLDGKPGETEQEMFWRVAYHVALAEDGFDTDIKKQARTYYDLLSNLEFFPNSPTFTGAGTPLGQLAACFVLPIEDDMGRVSGGIFQTLRDAALIQQTGGGNGFAFSRLRPKGAMVSSSRGEATGPVGFLRVYDQAFGEIAQGGCLTPDTLVFTDSGLLRLDELVTHAEVGWQSHDRAVATDEGLRLSRSVFNNGVVPVLKVTTDTGLEVTGTPNHKVKMMTADGPMWRRLDNLQPGDALLVMLGQHTGHRQALSAPDRQHGNQVMPHFPTELDESFAFFLGLLAGDGFIASAEADHRIGISVAHNSYLIDELPTLVRRLFGDAVHVQTMQKTDDSSVTFVIDNRAIKDFLTLNGLSRTDSTSVRVPRLIRQSDPVVVGAFLRGLFEADGAVSHHYPQLLSSSKTLIHEVATLLIGLGCPVKIAQQTSSANRYGSAPMWTLEILTAEAPTSQRPLLRYVRGERQLTQSGYMLLREAYPEFEQHARPVDDLWFVNVVSVEPTGESLTLDLEVDDNHTYLANGIVTHNSRRGANMAVLRVSHPDIRDFITCKTNENHITNFNISVGITDEFMRAVERDATFELVNPHDKKVWETVRAREIFELIVRQAHHNGEPGVLFLDAANRGNPVPHLYELESTNPCFVGSTRIATEQGLITIEALANGEAAYLVATDNRAPYGGHGTPALMQRGVAFRQASPAWKTRQQTPVLRLTTQHGFTVTATPDHRFLTATRGYVELRNLRQGDQLLLQSGEGAWSKTCVLPNVAAVDIALATMAHGGGHASGHTVTRPDFAAQYANVPTQWSHDLGMVLGWLVGDGWLSQDSGSPVGMTFSADKDEALSPIHDALRGWFGEGHLHDRGAIRQLTYGHLPYHFFSTLGVAPAAAHEKRVPDALWAAPREAVVGFLQALFTADGTVKLTETKRSCSIRLASASKGLLEDVQLLLLNFGIVSKLHHRRDAGMRALPDGKGGRKTYAAHDDYELIIDKANRDLFMEQIGFLSSAKQNRALGFIASKTRRSNREMFQTTVSRIEDAGLADVYDLTEFQMHSLIANGLVAHNCGEQFLGPFENCCLGSINLSKLNVANGKPDWDQFQQMIETSTRFLDDVVSANSYVPAVPQLAEAAHRVRRIGLGIMGLGDLMYKLGVRYGSEEGQEFAAQICEFLRYHAMRTSIELAKEFGSFPAIEGSLYDPDNLKWQPPTPLMPYERDWGRPALDWDKIVKGIKKHGIRNGAQTTIAPTGTIATVSGCEAYGCEPVFALAYIRHVNDKGQDLKLQYTSPLFDTALHGAGLTDDQIRMIVEEVTATGTCQHIEDLPEHIRHTFVVSSDVTTEEHIRMQAAMQRFIDNAISKTINMPGEATLQDVEMAYLLGWRLGCKGLTVYVTGSREKVVLETHATAKSKSQQPDEADTPIAVPEPPVPTVTLEPVVDHMKHRPRRLEGRTYRVGTPLGTTYVTVNENGDGRGQPFELFIQTSKAGSETAAVSEAIGRLISLVLRLNTSIKSRERLTEIVRQLNGIGGGRSTGFGAGRVRSLPDGVAQVLQEYLDETALEPTAYEVDPPPAQISTPPSGNGHHSLGAGSSAPAKALPASKIGDLCPECGEASVVNEEGCRKCYTCGFSEC